MNHLIALRLRAARAAWPLTLVILMLQRTPVLRVLASAEFAIGARTGQILRALVPLAAAVGVVDTVTGATQFSTTPGSPVNGKVGEALAVSFNVTGALTPAGSYGIDGALPPGLSVPGADVNGTQRTLNAASGFISGVPTQSGTFGITLSAWEFPDRTGDTIPNIFLTLVIAPGAGTAPSFSQQPQPVTVTVGGDATFTVAASGTPAPTFQWRKDNNPIAGQTGATLTLTNVQASDAGSYDCVATNTAGSTTSNAATLTVNAVVSPPSITVQPENMTSRAGSGAFFSVVASGGSSLTYQWRKGTTDIAGATASSLFLNNVQAADAGAYSVTVTNSAGSTTSDAATLTISATGTVRLSNLSARAQVGTGGDILIPGFVIGGSGSKNLLIRAVGPRLEAFHVAGPLPDPTMTIFTGGNNPTAVQTNDDWGTAPNQAAMETARASVFAFALAPSTKDSSLLLNLSSGPYTIQESGVGGTTGVGLVELYDTDPLGSPAHLVNISARAQVGTGGDILIPGFVIEGDVSMTLLVRGIGPRLSDFNVPGVLADPVMSVFKGGTAIASNDDWEQSPNLTALQAATTATFAFSLHAGSKDAAMLIALNPGAYTVQVSGKNDTTGVGLVELYQVSP